MGKKGSTSQVKLRAAFALDLMLQFKATATVRKALIKKFGIATATADRDIKNATTSLVKSLDRSRDRKLALAIGQREQIIELLAKDKNYTMVAQTLHSKNQLEGLLEQPDKAETVVNIKVSQTK